MGEALQDPLDHAGGGGDLIVACYEVVSQQNSGKKLAENNWISLLYVLEAPDMYAI